MESLVRGMMMIERVARAICTAAQIDPDRKGNETDWRWQEFLPEARAAIEAMREPTPPMLEAGRGETDWEPKARAVWDSMIDAALT